MKYKEYEISQRNNKVIVKHIKDFNLTHTFECGQCFRWEKEKDGSYIGVVKDKVINISLTKEELVITNSTIDEFVNFWYNYFDLGRDYSKIKEILSKKDYVMKKAIEHGYGIRLLQQEIWEVLISFIVSANNRIPMIKKTISLLSENFGNKILFNDTPYYTFPNAGQLASRDVETLKICRAGFRCKYIRETSDMIENGLVELSNIDRVNTDDARKILIKFPGVGLKVADCTLLYGSSKYDVFPTDVWVKRIMEKLYFHRETTLGEIQEFSREYFGSFAGFAQQYLFYYARENKIK